MATKSDFAQKLLVDLRRRKEQMTVADNSCNRNSGSRDAYGRSAQTYRGSGRIKALDSTGKIGGKSHPSSARSFNHEASSSNQIVPYGNGRISKEKSDLSVAFRLGFGNGSRVDITGNTALIKLLNQIGTKPLNIKAKKEVNTRRQIQLSSTPVSSSFHITEISKGVEKLKQVIKAYPNGLDLNGRSTQAGRELLKGAMDLEQSLRMLVNLQEASDQKASAQRKIKIRLLDEDEEDGDVRKATIRQVDQKKQVDRPQFSFDKPSNKNTRGNKESSATNYIKKHLMALTLPDETPKSDKNKETLISTSEKLKAYHTRSVSVPDFRTPTFSETQNYPNSSSSRQEKGRISNVIAKLMGLEALPQKENNNHTQKESSTKTKERSTSKTAISSARANLRDAERRRPTTIDKRMLEQNNVQPRDNGFRSAPGSIINSPLAAPTPERLVYTEQNISHNLQAPERKNVAALIGRESMAITTGRQPRHSINQSVHLSSGYCTDSQGHASEAKVKKEKQMMRESKKLTLPTEPRNTVQVQHKHTTQNADNYEPQGAKARGKASGTETRDMCRIHPAKQQHPHSYRDLQHLKRPNEMERQEDKYQVQKRKQHLGRQKLLAGGRKISSVESAISSETKNLYCSSRNTETNHGQEAQNKSKFLRPGESLMPREYLSHSKYYEKNVQQETPSKVVETVMPVKDLSRHTDHEKNVRQETPSELSVIQRRTDDGRTCDGGSQDKFDSVVNGKGKENAASPTDQSLVLQESIKDSSLEIHEEGTKLHEHHQHIEEEVANDHLETSINQLLNVKVTTHSGAMEFTKSCNPEKVGQLQETSQKLSSNEKQSQVLSTEGVVAFKENYNDGQPDVSTDMERKLEKPLTDQQPETGVEENNCNNILEVQQRRTLPLGIEERLTGSEELLKQKLTKSRYFLNTAEVLLQLNIPVQILQGDDDKVEDTETKLTLECSYELLKWKGKKHELREHPHSCLPNNYINKINSLTELIKQLHKDFDALNIYGGVDSEVDVADALHTMLEKDIQHGVSDVSFMWDHAWEESCFAFLEKDDMIKDIEKHMLNALLNEFTIDLLQFTTTV